MCVCAEITFVSFCQLLEFLNEAQDNVEDLLEEVNVLPLWCEASH